MINELDHQPGQDTPATHHKISDRTELRERQPLRPGDFMSADKKAPPLWYPPLQGNIPFGRVAVQHVLGDVAAALYRARTRTAVVTCTFVGQGGTA
jgi:hypothetical protein